MISVIARLKVRTDKTELFETTMKDLIAKVRSDEPACKGYQMCRGAEPGSYVMLESYDDAVASAKHMQTPHFRAAMGNLGACLAGAPALEQLEVVA